jgi:hypothetical protein
MASFPGSVWTGFTRGALLSSPTTQSVAVDSMRDEIIAIETTLGAGVQGGSTNVAARIAGTDRVSWTGAVTSLSVAAVSFSGNMTISSESEDNGGFWSSGTNVTVPAGKAGRYIITHWATSGVPASGTGGVLILVNGGNRAIAPIPIGGGDGTAALTCTLTAGAVLTFQIKNGHSSAVTFTSEINVTRIGL